MRLLALSAIAFVWYKVFYWMRLFEKPAFFMHLLIKTLHGIVPFMLFLVILTLGLSNMIYIVDKVDYTEL